MPIVNNQIGSPVGIAVNPDGSLIGSGGTTGTGQVTTVPLSAASVTNSGKQTTPVAATAIATIASGSLPAGTYEVQVWISVSGTATTAAADSNNMELFQGAGAVSGFLPYNCSTAGNVTNGGPFQFQLALTGSQALTVQAVGNATTGTVYGALIIATRVI
jgi:hypothetical protein